MILGGGAGSRLYPLTNSRAKPAVPIGGAYRLIDVPMSNCLNSGISKIYILTQFNSTSLNRHLARTYNLGASGVRFGGEAFVEVLAASQTPKEKAWFQGTADAVRQYMWLLEDVRHREVEDVIVLSGDHLYRMDYMQFVDAHRQSGADISIGCLPVDEHRASDFGLMQIDGSGRVRSFSEKPKGEALEKMKVDTTVLGLDAAAARRTPYIASMGIYVFKRHVMAELLRDYDSCNDFGGEIIPAAARERHVQAYLFNGYWEDIGTIESFFHANISLCANPPNFEFHDPRGPIYTSPRFLPPAKIEDCLLHDAVVSHGAVLARCEVRNAIVGLRSRVEEGVVVQNALVMGADYYESDARRAALRAKGEVPLGIGRGSRLDQVVLDKNARVGENVVIANREGVQEASREEQGVYIRSGIVVVARNTTIPSGTVI
ncbi:nucleotidyl transferase [Helicosporidium sp. ATCC 50920]|nr:nucleotidyl transferase [Helicosporidium sp. ATCC 50920]|eukprot:KDD76751.1 nucleotidyl transferase [Helicosporidium sp. ATCC 50920]